MKTKMTLELMVDFDGLMMSFSIKVTMRKILTCQYWMTTLLVKWIQCNTQTRPNLITVEFITTFFRIEAPAVFSVGTFYEGKTFFQTLKN